MSLNPALCPHAIELLATSLREIERLELAHTPVEVMYDEAIGREGGCIRTLCMYEAIVHTVADLLRHDARIDRASATIILQCIDACIDTSEDVDAVIMAAHIKSLEDDHDNATSETTTPRPVYRAVHATGGRAPARASIKLRAIQAVVTRRTRRRVPRGKT